jgi:hypothetical protein
VAKHDKGGAEQGDESFHGLKKRELLGINDLNVILFSLETFRAGAVWRKFSQAWVVRVFVPKYLNRVEARQAPSVTGV